MQRGVSKQLILTVSALLLVLVAAFAWFYIPKDPDAGSHVMTGGGAQLTVRLFLVTDENGVETETEIERIAVQNAVPGTQTRYRVRVTNDSPEKDYFLSFSMGGFRSENDDFSLCRYLALSENTVVHDPAGSPVGEIVYTGGFTELSGGDITPGSAVPLAENLFLGVGGSLQLTFTLQFEKAADNQNQQKTIYIDKLQYFAQ